MHKTLRYIRSRYQNLSKSGRMMLHVLGSVVGIWLVFLLLNVCFPLPAKKSYSQTILSNDSTLLCGYLTPDEKWRMHTSIDRVTPDMVKAIITKEDKWFYYHLGVNPVALGRAFWSNITSGRRLSGASTITMQLARMSDPAPRTYWHKFKEMFRALQFEWKYSKREILEMYLSYLPYGGNVEGVQAAAYIYFDRPPEKLSLSQSILLAVIPNRPNSLRLDRQSEAAKQARDKWIRRFRLEGVFSDKLLDAALNEPLGGDRYQITPRTPHFCYALRERSPDDKELFSTLDLPIQHTVERLLSNHTQRVRRQDVSNGAVMVIDNENGAVVAYCGSADFYDETTQGQVNGIKAIRSPGSALKPAVYAMGFDEGLITPKMKLLDVPTNYKGFTPENYDLTFQGEATVHDALTHSLNIPPVRLLDELGLEPFLDLLDRAKFETIRKKKLDLGLSVILGGCGVSLEELTRFYSNFARGGEMLPLSYTQEQLKDTGNVITLFSEGAAWLIADILSDIERPDLPKKYIDDSKLPRIGWKTGTSYGRRDAWSIGFSPRYTVGVWMGNFDGTGVPELSGSGMAVPLLIDIFNAIDYDPEQEWLLPPPSVWERKVCSETGLPPGALCEDLITDYYLINTSPRNTCGLRQNIFVNTTETIQYCPICLPDTGYHTHAYPNYDPELVLWWKAKGMAFELPPPHNPDCEAKFSGSGPKILSPSADFEYLLEKGRDQEILLQAASEPTITKHYWYINDRFFKAAAPDEQVFLKPPSGRVEVICMDDKGRKSKMVVEVKYY